MTVEWKPAGIVIGVVLAVAAVVALALYANLQFGGGDRTTSTSVVPPGSTEGGAENDVAVGGPPPPGAGTIATMTAFDPDGDAVENDAQAALAADDDPSTVWRTLCYSSSYMSGKRGVGIVSTFAAPTQAAVSADIGTGPFQVSFYATGADEFPPTLDGWGPPLGETQFADDAATVVSDVPAQPATHVLILLNQLGGDSGCTDANPFRGSLNNIAVAP